MVRCRQLRTDEGILLVKKQAVETTLAQKCLGTFIWKKRGLGSFKKMSIFSLSYPILRGCINTQGLMENPIL